MNYHQESFPESLLKKQKGKGGEKKEAVFFPRPKRC